MKKVIRGLVIESEYTNNATYCVTYGNVISNKGEDLSEMLLNELEGYEIEVNMNTPTTYLTVEVRVSNVSSFKGRLTLVELTHWRSLHAQPLYTVCRASSTSFTF